MRPLKLTMTAFGPFAGTQTLDFNELAGRNLFLIHGATGAGKTTILDGICFALYGAASDAERQARGLRSQHADPATMTEVELDFALGDDHYRIQRRPEQMRPKLRGEGETKEAAKALLWRLADGGDTRIVAEGYKDAGEEVERLLGFKCEQFRQVIMLPQGRFRDFLLADVKQRQQILETLFATEVYRRIEEELTARAADGASAMKNLAERKNTLLQQAGVESEAALQQAEKDARARLANLAEELQEKRKQDQTARALLEKGRQNQALLNEKAEAQKALAAQEERGPACKAKEERLAAARRAETAAAVEQRLEYRRRETQQAQKDLAAAQKRLTRAAADQTAAENALAEEKAREGRRREIAAEITRLKDLAPKAEELKALKKDADRAAAEQKRAEKRLADEKTAVKNRQEQRAAAELEKTELEKTARTADSLEAAAKAAEDAWKRRKQLTSLQKKLTTAQKEADAAETAVKDLESATADARRAWEAAQEAFQQSQAGYLAKSLTPGSPCPVCGSVDHPAPAHLREDAPEEARLKTLREQTEDLEKRLAAARAEEAPAKQAFYTVKAQYEQAAAELGDQAQKSPSEMKKEADDLYTRLGAAKAAAGRVADLEKKIQGLHTEEEKAQKQAADAEQAAGSARQNAASARAVLDDRQAQIPQAWRDPAAVHQAVDRAGRELADMEKALETARVAAQKAAEAHSAARAEVESAEKRLAAAQAEQAEQEKAFQAAVAAAGFASEAEYRAAGLTPDDISALEKEIRQYYNELSAAKDRFHRAGQNAAGLTPPDLDQLAAQAEAAGRALEAGLMEESRLTESTGRLSGLIRSLEELTKEFRRLEAEYQVFGTLAEAAKGSNPHKLTFQRFVLAAFLEDVLTAATQRLRIMSSGRYLLERAEEGRDRRSGWGLDLAVFDEYTGQSRPASTLSGGESFLAALALALGLSDVVQAHSGGVRLEAIFVDEGFGSLDPEALDLALRALFDLQQGGRLVGLISHVPELKERIPAHIEVTGGRQGSAARFV